MEEGGGGGGKCLFVNYWLYDNFFEFKCKKDVNELFPEGIIRRAVTKQQNM